MSIRIIFNKELLWDGVLSGIANVCFMQKGEYDKYG